MGIRNIKKAVVELLRNEDVNHALNAILAFPLRQVVNPLIQLLNSTEESLKWRVVTALGFVVSTLAENDMESARTVMRRLMWNLNSESGGIGWGSAEAMGEIMARSEKLADEYVSILISYLNQGGNYIENDHLQKGVLWAWGRLAYVRPELFENDWPLLLPFLNSKHENHRGLAAWVAGAFRHDTIKKSIERLADDEGKVAIYHDHQLVLHRIKELASKAQ